MGKLKWAELKKRNIIIISIVMSLILAAGTVTALFLTLNASTLVGRIHPAALGNYRLFSIHERPLPSIYWYGIEGMAEDPPNSGQGVPGGEIGTFCTHARMAAGANPNIYDQVFNVERGPNQFQAEITRHTGMNSIQLSEMRYAMALGLANRLWDTQQAYWAYLYMQRPDIFDNSGNMQLTPELIERWFGSKPREYNDGSGLNVTERGGLFLGDRANVRMLYQGSENIPQQLDARPTGDAVGPFRVVWDTAEEHFSPALAQVNYGPNGDNPPEFVIESGGSFLIYSSDPNTDAQARPSRAARLGQDFWIKYHGSDENVNLEVSLRSREDLATAVVADRFFYSYLNQHQFHLQLESGPFEASWNVHFNGGEPPPDGPRVEKKVAQFNGMDNEGEFENIIEVPVGADALYRVNLSINDDRPPTMFIFGGPPPRQPGDPVDIEITTAAQFAALTTAQLNNVTIRLMNDIDMAGVTYSGRSANGVHFDGGGHTIRNLTTTTPVFWSYDNGSIFDLSFENLAVNMAALPMTPNTAYGALASNMRGTDLRNLYVQGSFRYPNSWSTSNHRTGGIAGFFDNGTIQSVDARMDMTCRLNDLDVYNAFFGLFMGEVRNSTLLDCRVVQGSRLLTAGGNSFGTGFIGRMINTNATQIEIDALLEANQNRNHKYGISAHMENSTISRFTVHVAFQDSGVSTGATFIAGGALVTSSSTIEKGRIEIHSNVITNSHEATAGFRIGTTVNNSRVDISEVEVFVHPPFEVRAPRTSGLAVLHDDYTPGRNQNLTLNITDCSFDGTLNSTWDHPAAGILGYPQFENNATTNVTIRNVWSNARINPSDRSRASRIVSFHDRASNLTVENSYALGTQVLSGNQFGYIFGSFYNLPQPAVMLNNNFRTVGSAGLGNASSRHGALLAEAQVQGDTPHMAGNGWDIGPLSEGKTWRTTNGYPRLRDAGYRLMQIIYVHDYYFDEDGDMHEIGVQDMQVFEDGQFKNIRESRYGTDPQPANATQAHILLPGGPNPADRSFTFYVRRPNLPAGTFRNQVILRPTRPGWPGGEDDAWVEVRDKQARLNIVKMLQDNNYITTVDGVTFRLEEFANTHFGGTGVDRGTIEPAGMGGATFEHALRPGHSYILTEYEVPDHMSAMRGRTWYIIYTDTLEVFTAANCGDPGCEDIHGRTHESHRLSDDAVGAALQPDGVTVIYSFKVVNVLDDDVTRRRLRVRKFNEDGTQELFGEHYTCAQGLTRWSGALFTVMKVNIPGEFTGGREAYGFTLVPGRQGSDYIDLPLGDYVLIELQPPRGYALNPTEFWIRVTEDGIVVMDQHVPGVDQVNYMDGTQDLRAEIIGETGSGPRFTVVNSHARYHISDNMDREYSILFVSTGPSTPYFRMVDNDEWGMFWATCIEPGVDGPYGMAHLGRDYFRIEDLPDPRASLAQALYGSNTSAMISHQAFNDMFDLDVDGNTRMKLMQTVIWLIELDRRGQVPGMVMTDPNTWGNSPAMTELRAYIADMGPGFHGLINHCLAALDSLAAANEVTPSGQTITSLSMNYDTATNRLSFAHVGRQPPIYRTALSWSGSVQGLTVVIDGVTYANTASSGIPVTKQSVITVTYSGNGAVNFSLIDSANYLVASSIHGAILQSRSMPALQRLLVGHADFATLEYHLTIGEQSGGEYAI